MTSFTLHFILCNLFISLSILIVLGIKYLFKNYLSAQTAYRLWVLLFVLMALPFLPIRLSEITSIFFRVTESETALSTVPAAPAVIQTLRHTSPEWMNDFTVSVNSAAGKYIGTVCFILWLIGIFFMLIFQLRARKKLHFLKETAVPAVETNIKKIFNNCCRELEIKKEPAFYISPLLKTPVMTGIIKPGVYLPAHLASDISDVSLHALRHMLLHELIHYKQKDAFMGALMNLFHLLYWPNPLVWLAMNEIKNDGEIACDTKVLKVLGEEHALDYGHTLVDLAEKISADFMPFTFGIRGNMRQMTRRIRRIAAYRPPSRTAGVKSTAIGLAAALLLFGLAPSLSACALWVLPTSAFTTTDGTSDIADKTEVFGKNPKITTRNLSSFFGDTEGTFVLYDSAADSWQIYNPETALTRMSPDSTYKIYAALFALDAGCITPENSEMEWNGEIWDFEAWNREQDLRSAMANSVNWYFQALETDMGKATVRRYVDTLNYGNKDLSGAFPSCWLESSLKISPAEQVRLLSETFAASEKSASFNDSDIAAVKDALYLYEIPGGALYGKTGTGNIDGQNIRGWFVGFAETKDNTFFFAACIENPDKVSGNPAAENQASGSHAAEITRNIFADLGILR